MAEQNKENQIILTTDEGEEVLFYVLEQTRLSGINYLLVTDSEEDEADCYILKDTSKDEDQEACYEFVEDDETLEAVSGLFKALFEGEDTEIQ